MTHQFTTVAASILAADPSDAPLDARGTAVALELIFAAGLFSRAAGGDHPGAAGALPALRGCTTLLMIAAVCPSRTVCRHVVASLEAGNSVRIALFEPPDPLLLVLFAALTAHLPERFDILGSGRGPTPSVAETSIVVVTTADAFLNDAPGIRFRSDATEASCRALTGFYATASD